MSSDETELAKRKEELKGEWNAIANQRRILNRKWRKLYQTLDDLLLVGAYMGIGLTVLLIASYLLNRFFHGFH